MNIVIRHPQDCAVVTGDELVEILFYPEADEEPEPVLLTMEELAGLRDRAAAFIAGQELPGAEIARQRRDSRLGGQR